MTTTAAESDQGIVLAEYDFFLIHSSHAKPTAGELYQQLHGREGCRVFLDQESILEGSSWPDALARALEASRIAVILITPTVPSAFYAIEEIHRAIGLMRSTGSPLVVPVYLDGLQPGADSPYGLAGLHSLSLAPGSSVERLADQLLDRLRLIDQPPEVTVGASGRGVSFDLVVDPRGGSGSYSSIRRALDHAAPGARVLVRPGLYEEALTITQPVHLIGDGNPEDIIIQSFNATTITLAAPFAVIEGVTIRQQGGTFPYQAVDIAMGVPEIRRCFIAGGTRSCVRARGTSTPRIIANIITGTAAVGVELGDYASGEVGDNWIHGLAETGVWVGGRAHPIVRGNDVAECVSDGVRVLGKARVTVLDNRIVRCGTGVVCTDTGYITASRNHIDASAAVGVHLDGAAAGRVANCCIRQSGFAQLLVSTAGSPTFEYNTIADGRADGVIVERSEDLVTFRHNVISSNEWSGLFVRDGGKVRFRENLVVGNGDNGVTVHSGSSGNFESNLVMRNGQNGVSLLDADEVLLVLNRVEENGWSGVRMGGSSARCDRNQIRSDHAPAIAVEGASTPYLKENDLEARSNSAVLLIDVENAVLKRNRIHDSVIGVDVRTGTATIDVNSIDRNTAAIRVSPEASVKLEENSLAGNTSQLADGSSPIEIEPGNVVIDVVDDRARVPLFLDRLGALDPSGWGCDLHTGDSGARGSAAS